jgi:hypothetical protein
MVNEREESILQTSVFSDFWLMKFALGGGIAWAESG